MGCTQVCFPVGCRHAWSPLGCAHIWSPTGHRHLGFLWDACTHGPLRDTGRGAGNARGTSLPPGQMLPKRYHLPTAQIPAGHPLSCLPTGTRSLCSATASRQHPRSHLPGSGRRRSADASAAFRSPAYQMGPNYQQERDARYPCAVRVPPTASGLALPMPSGTAPWGRQALHIPQPLESIGNAEKHPNRFLNQTK